MIQDVIKNPETNKNLIKGGKTMQPHEIVKKVLPRPICGLPLCKICGFSNDSVNEESDPLCEAQFASVAQTVKEAGSLDKTVAMVDISASMFGLPMWVSISLGLLISQVQTTENW